MNRQMNIRRSIEVQRRKLDRMAGQTKDLTKLLEEAERMDWLIGIYESRKTAECIKKDA